MENSKKQKAICILGMHRSGTSAMARALNLLGTYIGPEERMLPATEDNPAGFWEHLDVYRFHERLLWNLTGFWDDLFPPAPDWWNKPDIEPYRSELRNIVTREFGGHNLWMWKDPRTSILLPLWKGVLSELGIDVGYIICWRNPADVAASLKRRNGFPKSKALALWHYYNLSSLYWTNGERRAVIRYENLLKDFNRTMLRVAELVDIPLTKDDKGWDVASSSIMPDLCHGDSAAKPFAKDPEVPQKLRKVYEFLAESEINAGFLDRVGSADEITALYNDYCDYASLFRSAMSAELMRQKDLEIGIRDAEIERLREEVEDKSANLGLRDEAMRNKDMHIDELMVVIKNKDVEIGIRDAEIERLREEVEDKSANLGLRDEAIRNKDMHINEFMGIIKDKNLEIENRDAIISENVKAIEELSRLRNMEKSWSWRTVRACLDIVDRVLRRQ